MPLKGLLEKKLEKKEQLIMEKNMLRVISQFFDRKYYPNHPMQTTEQCEGCGRTPSEFRDSLRYCEHCRAKGKEMYYCPDCLQSHEQEHFKYDDFEV